MNNRYIIELPNGTNIDIRKIISMSCVENTPFGAPEDPQNHYCFEINAQGYTALVYFGTEEEAKKERMRLLETWYSTAAEDAVKSGVFDYEMRRE